MEYGNAVVIGTAEFRACIDFKVFEQSEEQAYIKYKYAIHVDKGNFGGLKVARSWGSPIALNGVGWYGAPGEYDSPGWEDIGWVDYGTEIKRTCTAQVTTKDGITKRSSCTASFVPQPPVFAPMAISDAVNSRVSNIQNNITWRNVTTTARPYTSIEIYRSEDGGAWVKLATISGSLMSYEDHSTRAGSVYRYRLIAVNSKGKSSPCETNATKNLAEFPAVPTDVIASRKNDSGIDVTWKNNSTASAPYETLILERSVDGSLWSALIEMPGEGTGFHDGDVTENRTYAYRVCSKNAAGQSVFAVSNTVYTTPAPPDGLKAVRNSTTSITLSIDNARPFALATRIERSQDGVLWTEVTTTDGKAFSYTDTPGGGSWWYRARNAAQGLTSAFAQIYVPEAQKPQLPTLISPESGAMFAATETSLQFSWLYNPNDCSVQSAAELQYSTDGQNWTTVSVGSEQSVSIPNKFKSEVFWRVRTRGCVEEWGDWSGNRVFSVKNIPQVSLVEPSSITSLPLTVEVAYSDPSGSLANLMLDVTDKATGKRVYAADMGVKLTHEIGRTAWIPESGKTYRFTVTARSTSGFQVLAATDIGARFAEPKPATVVIDADRERGHVTLTTSINTTSVGVDVKRISIWRVVGEDEMLLAENLTDGQFVVDKHAPLNIEYHYKVISWSADGGMKIAECPGSVKTPYAFLYFDGKIARGRWNPDETIALNNTGRTLQKYAGRKYPVLYDGGGMSESRSLSLYILDDAEAMMFKQAAEASRCVYKSLDGDVFWCVVDVSFVPLHYLPNQYGSVNVTITRIDGDAL